MISHHLLQRNLLDLSCPLPDIREGAYSFFLKTIIEENRFDLKNKNKMLRNLLSEKFLFKGIEKGVCDETCARSFTLLVINLIIASDTDFYLDLDELYVSLEHYIEQEVDFRDYDEKLGWIHTAAHFSDLLVTLDWHKNKKDHKNKELAEIFYNKIYPNDYWKFSKVDRGRISEAFKSFS